MSRPIPRPGEKYIHFKKKVYQIICVAKHSETGERFVVYQALYGEFSFYIRPLEMFMSEVDYEKYPNVTQKYRFELADELPAEKEKDVCKKEVINPALLQFLEADTLEQKYEILKSLQGEITNRLIDDFAVALDVVIPDGKTDVRYQQLLSTVRTMQRYESNRLR